MLAPTLPTPPDDAAPSGIARREVKIWKMLSVAALVVLSLASVSYVRALMAPGYATWNDKTSSWIRDHGGTPALNLYENWRYASPPPDTQPDLTRHDSARAQSGGSVTSIGTLPVLPAVAGAPAPTWIPGRAGADGVPLVYTSVFQPDPAHRSAVAGVAIVSGSGTIAHLVEGKSQPLIDSNAAAAIPSAQIPNLVAAFNSGWKMKDVAGGYFSNGTALHGLQNGQASAVIDDAGHLRVIDWTSGAAVNPHIVAVRQNLALIVDRGAVADGLHSNGDSRWGSAKNQLQYTERSALGTTAGGDLVYVAASKVDLPTLAQALLDAGAVTGMELDIHGGLTEFNSWAVDHAGTLTPTAVLPSVQHKPDRYLAPDQRDFFYLTLASQTPNQRWASANASANASATIQADAQTVSITSRVR
ncbi:MULTISPECIES: phosphodiester glycosidase family protein [unclassified Rhodococcus (in: high G+C Gram-positive bacteria)]|uniref:phosphodiester glycosidase family protein n=1 Tax=unclassified Rhodococcus (in: high G+C Gram-positive bacteria) TaxID=192944 RepID=UPI0033919340